jgi:chitin disaccharide deacetylase
VPSGNSLKPAVSRSAVIDPHEQPRRCPSALSEAVEARGGRLIINADDWGRDRDTTEPILRCKMRGTVSSVSAMVFMEDSERAAAIARERGIDAGLHLNFTAPLTAPDCPAELKTRQHRLSAYLLRHPLARIIFHPGLTSCFEYVIAAQIDEFRRLYGTDPTRIDGHHHQHLCANVLLGGLLREGTLARRNFTFQAGEKSIVNRLYRQAMDGLLKRKHRVVDGLFSLAPLEPAKRLRGIVSLARTKVVEVETHPINPEEHRFLMGDGIFRLVGDVSIASCFSLDSAECMGSQSLRA